MPIESHVTTSAGNFQRGRAPAVQAFSAFSMPEEASDQSTLQESRELGNTNFVTATAARGGCFPADMLISVMAGRVARRL